MELSLSNYDTSTQSMFMFSVDGVVKMVFDTEMSHETFKLDLDRGDRVLQWTFRHKNDPSVNAKIHKVVIFGINDGEASTCNECPTGQISTYSTSFCQLCEPG